MNNSEQFVEKSGNGVEVDSPASGVVAKAIKFRQPIHAADGTFKRFAYWGFIDGAFKHPAGYVDGRPTPESQQFTGLHDKNGVEIYEGDILPLRYLIGVGDVYWDRALASFELRNSEGGEHLLDVSGPNDLGYNPWEIIGNIYENPELLSGSRPSHPPVTGRSTEEENNSDV